jgi:energy-coupling factor transporter ATP-binding protein EcfA2
MNEDINYEEIEMSKEEEEYLYKLDENTKIFNTNLPSFIRRFQQDAVKVAFKNDIPAALSCFVILGQICKDFVQIPNGRSIEDSRVHMCQIQTSGSGKSTLWAFLKPVIEKLYAKINASKGHPVNKHVSSDGSVDYAQWDGVEGVEAPSAKQFNIMSTTEYTDAALIGGYEEAMIEKTDDEGNTSKELGWLREAGLLEGSGLAHWDEFEYSGVFKQSQNKEQAIVYLNTLMNTLAGESWKITKKLKRGKMMNCYCERSILAMTYPPEKLAKVIANKGVLQRMILFIWDVPENVLDIMRRMQISKAGKIEEINAPIEEFANEFFEIYEIVKERFEKVKDPLKTMKYTQDFNDVLLLEYETMKQFIGSSDPVVRKIASNFTTRLLKILIKMSVLCSIAEAKDIKNEGKRFVVSGRNVRQAGNIVRQCYNTLVLWLERSLKVTRRVGNQNQSPNEQLFLETIRGAKKDEDGFSSKQEIVNTLRSNMTNATIYRLFNKYKSKNMFEENKMGRSVYLKLKEEKK